MNLPKELYQHCGKSNEEYILENIWIVHSAEHIYLNNLSSSLVVTAEFGSQSGCSTRMS